MVLTCRFLFDLRKADRTATIPSSPSAVPSLIFNHLNSSQHSRGTLPAFIASMGLQIPAGAPFGVETTGRDEDAATGTAGEGEFDGEPEALEPGIEPEHSSANVPTKGTVLQEV